MDEELKAANTNSNIGADNANGKDVEFTDGAPAQESQPQNNNNTQDKTKAFSERLKRERAKMEQEFNSKKQQELDAVAVSRGFKDWKELNDYTKKDALEELGIKDADKFNNFLNSAIAENPVIAEAQRIINAQKEKERNDLLVSAISEINKLDSDIKTVDDLTKIDNYDEFYSLVEKGYSLPDAYKIVAFDKITSNRAAAAAQNVITNNNSKEHFKPLGGGKATDVVVPSDVLESYRKNMPDMTDQEIKAHYSKYLGGK